ncbi:MAG: hypothetical protein QM714_00295 [Nocardioides sp.]|uniref:hypothetical protein n=1 Tax=Nocardioides sp. TaxID=35761 RepID=UPI0039E36D55
MAFVPLMVRLDHARGHQGAYDDTSYALAQAAVEWAEDRLAAEGMDPEVITILRQP